MLGVFHQRVDTKRFFKPGRSVKLAEQLELSREKRCQHLALVYYALGNYGIHKTIVGCPKIMRAKYRTPAPIVLCSWKLIFWYLSFADAGREAESIRYGREGIALARRLQRTLLDVGGVRDSRRLCCIGRKYGRSYSSQP